MMLEIKLGATIALILVIASHSQHVNAADESIKCYNCTAEDANCLNDPSKVQQIACTAKKCYTKTDAGKISRGCLTEGPCENPGCYQCESENCNNNHICKSCTSSSTDPDCSRSDADKESYNSICSDKINSCITLVREDKQLERRCAKDGETCSNTDTCSICTGVNCNVGIFPSKRIRCYQCPGTDTKCSDVDANKDVIKSFPCLLYSVDDKCFTFGTSATTMTRGCVSDTDTNVNKCSQPESTEACGACDKDNCNNRIYQRDPELKCVQCNSSVDPNCQYDQKVESAKVCKEKLLFNQNESCYLETLTDKTVKRGCLYDRTKEDGACKAPECETCDSNGCNSQPNTNFTCIRCRSDLEPKCKNDVKNLKDQGQTCRNQALTDTNKNCFYGTWNNVVIRGCLVDADERQQIACADKNNNQCKICTGKDCNKANGAAIIKISTSLLALIALFLWRLH